MDFVSGQLYQWDSFQSEVVSWSKRNFGDQEAVWPFLGMIEEVGEALAAKTVEDRKDGIADCVIYMADFLGRSNVRISAVIESSLAYMNSTTEPRAIGEVLGSLAHAVLKTKQGIRTNENHQRAIITSCGELFDCLWCAASHPMGLLAIVSPVWAEVQQRDWKKNAVDGSVGKQ